jgi:adenylate cyclase class 2
MYEVEVKVRADHARVRDRLTDRDADHVETVRQVDTYFDSPHRDFAETDEALRIRREQRDDETVTRLTYKGPLVEAESKTREEIEADLTSGDDVRAILEALDFSPAATVTKDRERFRLDGFTVTLDSVEGLGEFLEVETEVETEPEVEAAREKALSLLESLDLDPDEQIRTSYLGLLLAADG